jgi:peptide chain release factor subunit 1
MFRSSMPKAWQSLIVGSFPMGMTAAQTEVLAKAMQVGLEAERHREARLVETAITAAAKGGAGAVGLDETLKASHAGRVQTLLVFAGYHAAGYRCQNCGFMTTVELPTCPECGEKVSIVSNIVDHAVRSVMRSGGGVEIVHYSPALKSAGNIGATLRH